MWTFNRAQGKIVAPNLESFSAYSGHGDGVNNPALEQVHDVGPIPAGLWDIGSPFDDPTHGPYALRLTPQADTNTFGRSGFLIHGDEIAHVGQQLASLGCVITARSVREMIGSSGDRLLQAI